MSGVRKLPTVNGKTLTEAEYEAWSRRRAEFLKAAGQDLATGLKEGTVTIGVMTDKVFLEGHCNGGQFETTPWAGDYYKEVAEAHGQSVKGKVYLSGLAAFPGDPRAWVDGRGDVRRVLEERGWNGRGAVNVTGPPAEGPPERVAVAPDILERQVALEVEADPSLAEMDPGELRHELTQKLRPHWSE